MAKKITQLPAGADANADDLLEVAHDPSGVPVSQKMTISQVRGIQASAVDPNGVITATGPAIVLGSGASSGFMWVKVTAGTSNNEWNQVI